MRPHLDATGFGWVEIDGERYELDVLIRLDGKVRKRKKKLSKRVYGTSHTVSLEEAEYVYEKGARLLVIGTGQHDNVRLSPQAAAYFDRQACQVCLAPTPDAVALWNAAPEHAIGLFHVTC